MNQPDDHLPPPVEPEARPVRKASGGPPTERPARSGAGAPWGDRILIAVISLLTGFSVAFGGDAQADTPTAVRKVTLVLASDLACTVKLDGEKVADLEAGEPKKISVSPARYFVSATTPDGQRWAKAVNLTGAKVLVKIDFTQSTASSAPATPKQPATRKAPQFVESADGPGIAFVQAPIALGLRWVKIPAGEFQMGCAGDNCSGNEQPAHLVKITRPFEMNATEITAGQFQKYAEASGVTMAGQPSWSDELRPVVNVNWNEAEAFCNRAGGRLPTEAEWEYAARGGTSTARYGSLDDVAWYKGNSGHKAQPVGGKKPNAFGLYDMLGNVWEWTSDVYADYQVGFAVNPTGPPSGAYRVIRGGSCFDDSWYVLLSIRWRNTPAGRSDAFGFRCVRDAAD